jgi:hypothetical protein
MDRCGCHSNRREPPSRRFPRRERGSAARPSGKKRSEHESIQVTHALSRVQFSPKQNRRESGSSASRRFCFAERSWVGGPEPALPGGGRVCIRPAGKKGYTWIGVSPILCRSAGARIGPRDAGPPPLHSLTRTLRAGPQPRCLALRPRRRAIEASTSVSPSSSASVRVDPLAFGVSGGATRFLPQRRWGAARDRWSFLRHARGR